MPQVSTVGEFLEHLETLLSNIATKWHELLFRKDDRLAIQNAWNDVSVKLTHLRWDVDDPNSNIHNQLHAAGLRQGPELTLKMQLVSRLWENFDIFGGKKLLKKLLDYINKILDSIPGAEPIKEFKDACEIAMGDDE